jgi:hypothetical protein
MSFLTSLVHPSLRLSTISLPTGVGLTFLVPVLGCEVSGKSHLSLPFSSENQPPQLKINDFGYPTAKVFLPTKSLSSDVYEVYQLVIRQLNIWRLAELK